MVNNLSPKDKAIDLVQKFEGLVAIPSTGIGNIRINDLVRQRALICCDEIIQFLLDAVTIVCEDGGEILEPRQYWIKVKAEIKKL